MKSVSRNSEATPALLIWVILMAIAVLLIAGCALVDGTDNTGSKTALIKGRNLEFVDPVTFNRSDFPADAAEVVDASLVSDSLVLMIRHSGGCESHIYRLIAWNYWLESLPVQLHAILAHDDQDDPCDAIVTERVAFGLTTLRNEFFEAYAGPGDVVLEVSDDIGNAYAIRYQFSNNE